MASRQLLWSFRQAGGSLICFESHEKHEAPVKAADQCKETLNAAEFLAQKMTLLSCVQGHVDMVTEKNADVQHDFFKDPLKLERNGDWLKVWCRAYGALGLPSGCPLQGLPA